MQIFAFGTALGSGSLSESFVGGLFRLTTLISEATHECYIMYTMHILLVWRMLYLCNNINLNYFYLDNVMLVRLSAFTEGAFLS